MSMYVQSDMYTSQLKDDYGILNAKAPNPAEFHETPETSRSYWIREFQVPFEEESKTAPIPAEADVVIIGSGITGAMVALRLSEQKSNLRVAMVEARGICTGATGRNGGHTTRAEAYHIRGLAQAYGTEDAVRIRKSGVENIRQLKNIINQLGIADEVDYRPESSVGVFATENERDSFAADEEFAREHGMDLIGKLISREEAIKITGLPETFQQFGGAYTKYGGVIWPRKLVAALLRTAKERMLSFSTHTFNPVTAVNPRNPEDPKTDYEVVTSKGSIRARAVFHATNGYANHLIPELRGKHGVYGVKSHVLAIQPNKPCLSSEHGATHLPPSFGYDDANHWIAQVPRKGPFVYGFSSSKTEPIGDFDDTTTYRDEQFDRSAMFTFLETAFPHSFENIDRGRDVKYDWTGVMGFTMTGASVVGRRHKDRLGEFLSVAHNGEGMNRCCMCATVATEALIAFLDGNDAWMPPEWFPHIYRRNI